MGFALRAPDGASVTLERFPILVGRVTPGGPIPDVDLSHLDPNEAVDSHHCELNLEEDGVEVHDLGGISGTWVDGRRLPPGGRALLRLGGTLRVAGVTLSLVPSSARRPSVSAPPPPGPPFGGWGTTDASRPAPPPPSAIPTAPAPAPASSGDDLSGAPPLARPELERGAEAVRLEPGFQLRALRHGRWESVGEVLSEGVVDDALRTVRRVLDLTEDAASGGGAAGDLSIDFVAPPLTGHAFLQLRLDRWEPPPAGAIAQAAAIVDGGGTVLLGGRSPRRLAVALAAHLDPRGRRPRVLDWAEPRAPGPEGWPQMRLDVPGSRQAALEGDPLLVIEAPTGELGPILRALPRVAGGTALGIRSASAPAALVGLVAALTSDPATSAAWVAATVDAVLIDRSGDWELGRPLFAGGRWSLGPLDGEP